MSQRDDRPLTLRRFLELLTGRRRKSKGTDEGPRVVGYVAPGEEKISAVDERKKAR